MGTPEDEAQWQPIPSQAEGDRGEGQGEDDPQWQPIPSQAEGDRDQVDDAGSQES